MIISRKVFTKDKPSKFPRIQSPDKEECIPETPCTMYRARSFFFSPSVGIVRPCNASRFSLSKRSFLKRRRKSKPAMRGYTSGRSLRRWNQGETFRMKLQRAPGRVMPEWYNSPVRYMSSYAVDIVRSRGCAFSMRGALLSSKSICASPLCPGPPPSCRQTEGKKDTIEKSEGRETTRRGLSPKTK